AMAALSIALMLANRRLAAARAAADRDSRTLADERRRLAEVIWGTNVGTWEWNVATGETVFNERWAEIVGHTLDELAPVDIETWSRLVHPDDLKRSVAALERHFSGQDQYYECEARMRHASGRWVWVLDRGKVVEWSADGKPLRMSGTHLDISERKDAELAERQTAHRLEVILDSVSEGIYGIDSDGRTTFVNRAATRMLGWTREEMLGAGERQPNRKDEAGEAMFLREDGTSFPAEYVSSPAVDPDGRVSGAVVVFRNVGERTKLLHNLERSNAELEQFAYVVSHDLRQPLRMINSYSTLLARRLGDGLDAEGREFLHFVCEGAIRMDRMLISLLEYSRVGRKGQPMDWIDSGAVLDEALLYLKPDTDELGAEISVEGEMPTVFASRDEMTRLFQNLLGNAIKYRAADRRPRVAVSVAAMPGEWVFAVRDNGIGIDPRQFGRLFQVFQRLHGQGRYEGTGIGLAVCRKIVERHGGRVWVESPGDGAGSTFLFTLPRCPPAAVAPPPSSERIFETMESSP
ncbi:MAG: PAS domain S-box protein, partial [Alphaproteobacteria bacterium]|nr:PAS domain S-box protein [Alphaproteobacteria bacterium]